MSEAMEWQGSNLLLTLERDPETILVRLFPAKYAPRRLYVFETAAYRSKELERENAKLRELVRDMWSDLQKQLMPPWSGEYEHRLRELGIEVDE